MKKFVPFLAAIFAFFSVQAQKNDSVTVKLPKPITDWSKLDLKNRANDHFMVQAGYDAWGGKPDSIKTKGFGRHLNIYGMYDMPFKTNPKWSVALGVGIGSSNIYFDKMRIDMVPDAGQSKVIFTNAASAQHFKKYKLTNVWGEIPVELRWVSNPFNTNKSFKVAVGAKVGSMISSTLKGKNLLSTDGKSSVHGTKYVMKEKDKTYFNSTKLAFSLRAGYGAISLFGSYNLMPLFKEGQGPAVHPYSIGLSISGL